MRLLFSRIIVFSVLLCGNSIYAYAQKNGRTIITRTGKIVYKNYQSIETFDSSKTVIIKDLLNDDYYDKQDSIIGWAFGRLRKHRLEYFDTIKPENKRYICRYMKNGETARIYQIKHLRKKGIFTKYDIIIYRMDMVRVKDDSIIYIYFDPKLSWDYKYRDSETVKQMRKAPESLHYDTMVIYYPGSTLAKQAFCYIDTKATLITQEQINDCNNGYSFCSIIKIIYIGVNKYKPYKDYGLTDTPNWDNFVFDYSQSKKRGYKRVSRSSIF